MHFTFRKGLGSKGSCIKGPVTVPPVKAVAVLGRDYPGVLFDLKVAEGDQVAIGQSLCVDRHRPDVAFVASAAGTVRHIQLGPRRRLEALEIDCEGQEERGFDIGPIHQDDAKLRDLLLKSGAWASFRTRPFGLIPNPWAIPSAIFVTATDTNPLAPDPVTILAQQIELFQHGAKALLRLTDGPVFICQPVGPPLIAAVDRIRTVTFSGPHPAGLSGTHIHHVMPASVDRTVWQIGYQDVAAIGYLLEKGRIMSGRIVSAGGGAMTNASLVEAPLGARLSDLLQGQHLTGAKHLLSGSILSGQRSAYLGRHDLQMTVMGPDRRKDVPQTFWHRALDRIQAAPTGATLPLERFERVFPFDLLPAPILRALAVGDVETAARLGCLELLEDDMAVLSHLCPSGSDYGMLLRRTLDVLAQEQAA